MFTQTAIKCLTISLPKHANSALLTLITISGGSGGIRVVGGTGVDRGGWTSLAHFTKDKRSSLKAAAKLYSYGNVVFHVSTVSFLEGDGMWCEKYAGVVSVD